MRELEWAVTHGVEFVVRYILDLDPSFLSPQLLCIAVSNADAPMARLLTSYLKIYNGRKVLDERVCKGSSPLEWTLKNSDNRDVTATKTIVDDLLRAGASPTTNKKNAPHEAPPDGTEKEETTTNEDEKQNWHQMSMMIEELEWAVLQGDEFVVNSVLIAEPSLANEIRFLCTAIANGNVPMVQLLLSHMSQEPSSLRARRCHGSKTPVEVASDLLKIEDDDTRYQSMITVRDLLDAGFAPPANAVVPQWQYNHDRLRLEHAFVKCDRRPVDKDSCVHELHNVAASVSSDDVVRAVLDNHVGTARSYYAIYALLRKGIVTCQHLMKRRGETGKDAVYEALEAHLDDAERIECQVAQNAVSFPSMTEELLWAFDECDDQWQGANDDADDADGAPDDCLSFLNRMTYMITMETDNRHILQQVFDGRVGIAQSPRAVHALLAQGSVSVNCRHLERRTQRDAVDVLLLAQFSQETRTKCLSWLWHVMLPMFPQSDSVVCDLLIIGDKRALSVYKAMYPYVDEKNGRFERCRQQSDEV